MHQVTRDDDFAAGPDFDEWPGHCPAAVLKPMADGRHHQNPGESMAPYQYIACCWRQNSVVSYLQIAAVLAADERCDWTQFGE